MAKEIEPNRWLIASSFPKRRYSGGAPGHAAHAPAPGWRSVYPETETEEEACPKEEAMKPERYLALDSILIVAALAIVGLVMAYRHLFGG